MPLEFLLEIGCEELPAQFVDSTLDQLRHRFGQTLTENSLEFDQIATWATPRRLIVHIRGLAALQPPRSETVTGPPYSIAFDASRNPTRAAEGFARKYGLSAEDLVCVDTEKGQYLGFVRRIPGRHSRDILNQEVPAILAALDFPKNMRWEESDFLFVRPIRWLLCLLDGDVLPVTVAGVEASDLTFGHRILENDRVIQVTNFEEYSSSLLNCHIIFDPKQREVKISKELEQTALQHQAQPLADSELLKTVVYLNEHPSVICGSFEPSFLRLPREVLVTVLREHQKYFSVQTSGGELLPKFLAVVDSDELHSDLIRRGHERVLKARLADASFFWDLDRKVTLEERVDKLKGIVFQVKLGSIYEKSRRIAALTGHIARSVKRSDLTESLTLAARLCKTDLTTEMVREFTRLQGIMGGLYAKSQGISDAAADAIYDHYRPVSIEDASPRSVEGAILSLADKLDSVIGAFSIGLVPTGSRDPLSLRRQTLGMVKVLLDKQLGFSFNKVLLRAYSAFKKRADRGFEETRIDFQGFLKDRLKFVFKEQGYRYDEVNAIVEVDFDNPLDCSERLKAISGMRQSPDFYSLVTSFKRIKNIIVKSGIHMAGPFVVNPDLFQQEEERLLHQRIELTEPKVRRAQKSHQYRKAFELMASLRPQVDLFFDKVLVMTDDPSLQKNRLALLGSLLELIMSVADISEIVVS